jgi:transcriptional regulator with XRE-family HTH domain
MFDQVAGRSAGRVLGNEAIQRKLSEALLEARSRNPAFSLRAFARKLEMSPSAISELLNGKRRVSRKLASRIVGNLGRNFGMNSVEGEALLGLFPDR